jgi:hypothetical protein
MKDILANPQIVGALIALSGFIVAGLSSWVLAVINRRYDDRRHLRQVAIETAIEYWKQDIETSNLRGQLTGTNQIIMPLDTYIVHMLQLAELVSSKRLTVENIESELMRIRAVTHEATKAAERTRGPQ